MMDWYNQQQGAGGSQQMGNQLSQQQMRQMYSDHVDTTCGTFYQHVLAQPPAPPLQIAPTQPEKKSMFKEIGKDIKAFILEHRGVIYFIAAALVLDHFIFRGAFKARLQSMADRVVTKVEEQIK